MNRSVVRRGNHFIRLENEWCLIDGPWFSYLERLSNGSSMPVRLPYFGASDVIVREMTADEMYEHLSSSNIQEVEWMPKRWYPGFVNPWRFRREIDPEPPMLNRWNAWMAGRIKTGYILLPDGRLPEFLAAPDTKGDEDAYWWHDAWEWYDTFEYYFSRKEVKRLDGKEGG